jgi:DNA polymerase-3 subunit delta
MAHDLPTLLRALQSGDLKPVYIIQGDERLLVDEAVLALTKAAHAKANDQLEVYRLDLSDSNTDTRAVMAACQSMGLFTARNLVFIREAELLDKKSGFRDELAAYTKAPNPNTTLVLVAKKLNGSTKLVKTVKKDGGFYTFAPLRTGEVPGWIRNQAQSMGHRMDIPVARYIADMVGKELLQLRLVIDQLSLFVGRDAPITTAAVEACLSSTRAHSIFELVDAVGEKRPHAALEHLGSMLNHREPPLRILAMLIRHFRMLWQVSAHKAQGAVLQDVTQELKLHPFQAQKLWAQSNKFSHRSIQWSYERLFETDFQLKSAGLDNEIVIERLVMNLCSA